jgi:hypothetical protein
VATGGDSFEVQEIPVATCVAFNDSLMNTGWKDFDGVVHTGWAGGTAFWIKWKPTWVQHTRAIDASTVEVSTTQITAGWYPLKRMGRVAWQPTQPISEGCRAAAQLWIEEVEKHERAHAASIDARLAEARKTPVVAALSARGRTKRAATKQLATMVDAKLTELAGPLIAQIKADEAEFHEKNTVPLMKCDAC